MGRPLPVQVGQEHQSSAGLGDVLHQLVVVLKHVPRGSAFAAGGRVESPPEPVQGFPGCLHETERDPPVGKAVIPAQCAMFQIRERPVGAYGDDTCRSADEGDLPGLDHAGPEGRGGIVGASVGHGNAFRQTRDARRFARNRSDDRGGRQDLREEGGRKAEVAKKSVGPGAVLHVVQEGAAGVRGVRSHLSRESVLEKVLCHKDMPDLFPQRFLLSLHPEGLERRVGSRGEILAFLEDEIVRLLVAIDVVHEAAGSLVHPCDGRPQDEALPVQVGLRVHLPADPDSRHATELQGMRLLERSARLRQGLYPFLGILFRVAALRRNDGIATAFEREQGTVLQKERCFQRRGPKVDAEK